MELNNRIPYNNQMQYFKSACRMYRMNKMWLSSMNESMKQAEFMPGCVFDYVDGVVRTVEEAQMRQDILKEHVKKVEKTLEEIEMFYGHEAYQIMVEAYIHSKKRKEIAEHYGMNEQQLVRQMVSWLSGVLYQRNRYLS